jgi:AraC-like DNA-binding protein
LSPPTASPRPTAGFRLLLEVCRRLKFEPHNIARQLDARGCYAVELDDEFPLLIKLFRYSSRQHTRGATWHDRLEVFLPLDGRARFRMGDQEFDLHRGDLLVVDNLKLHHVVDFPGFDTRAVVVSFLPEFVYSLGSPSYDYAFLLPFYSTLDRTPQVLHASDSAAAPACQALARLLDCYFGDPRNGLFRAGCKAFLLEFLYHLASHFRSHEVLKWEFTRQQQRTLRLKPLFDHIRQHHADRLPVPSAARMVGMSPPRFMKIFKQVAGMTLVAYLNHVRLSNAARHLRESDLSIAEVASRVGFADQSYFDRRFKRAFGQSPKDYRRAAVQPVHSTHPGR